MKLFLLILCFVGSFANAEESRVPKESRASVILSINKQVPIYAQREDWGTVVMKKKEFINPQTWRKQKNHLKGSYCVLGIAINSLESDKSKNEPTKIFNFLTIYGTISERTDSYISLDLKGTAGTTGKFSCWRPTEQRLWTRNEIKEIVGENFSMFNLN